MGIARYTLNYSTEADVGYKDHQLLQAAELPVQNTKTKPEENHFNFMRQKKPWVKIRNIFLRKQNHVRLWVAFAYLNTFVKPRSFSSSVEH